MYFGGAPIIDSRAEMDKTPLFNKHEIDAPEKIEEPPKIKKIEAPPKIEDDPLAWRNKSKSAEERAHLLIGAMN
jgi:hypothetical protein